MLSEGSSNKPLQRFLLLIAAFGIAAAGLYYWSQGEPPPARPAGTEPVAENDTPAPPRHPVDGAGAPDGEPLPPLAESDDALSAAAERFIGADALKRLFHVENIARRVVVTIDNLPARQLPQRYSLAHPVPGRFAAAEDGEVLVLDRKNYERYAPYVKLAEALDTGKVVAAYKRFYPLLQQEYENIGYADAYFNDRVVAVIDELLAAPEIDGPVRLVRPRVMYEYADPGLESLSAGQKILVRMGPENAARIKAKLREIRAALTSAS